MNVEFLTRAGRTGFLYGPRRARSLLQQHKKTRKGGNNAGCAENKEQIDSPPTV